MSRSRPDPAAGLDPVAAAQSVGLRYIRSAAAGITRRRHGRRFVYVEPGNRRVTDPDELERIRRLVVPPAWREVWICPDPRGHLQATGRDARGRKQYRYHARWRAVRDETKYDRMVGFGEALPRLREQVERDLALAGLPRARVLATVVRLLDRSFIRVGNEEYARHNKSYGLTTLRDDHVDVSGSRVRFEFPGKGGKGVSVELDDRRVARVLRRCQDLPGQDLFQCVDEAGNRQAVGSADVNEYLRQATGQDFTAKDFRTWGASVLAATALRAAGLGRSAAAAKRMVADACRRVADRLGNTPAICRKSYIHPGVIDAYLQGVLVRSAVLRVRAQPGLSVEEAFLLAFLRALATTKARQGAAGDRARCARSRRPRGATAGSGPGPLRRGSSCEALQAREG
jgi:DNA topoisomerase-1